MHTVICILLWETWVIFGLIFCCFHHNTPNLFYWVLDCGCWLVLSFCFTSNCQYCECKAWVIYIGLLSLQTIEISLVQLAFLFVDSSSGSHKLNLSSSHISKITLGQLIYCQKLDTHLLVCISISLQYFLWTRACWLSWLVFVGIGPLNALNSFEII